MQLNDLRIFTEPQQGASYDDLLAVARRAEALGFGAFFRSDHYLKMSDVSGLPGPTDAWITLAGLARDTTTIRLGTLVSPVTFRGPGDLVVDEIQSSGGGIRFHRAIPIVVRKIHQIGHKLRILLGGQAGNGFFDF